MQQGGARTGKNNKENLKKKDMNEEHLSTVSFFFWGGGLFVDLTPHRVQGGSNWLYV